ncbi:MAG: hypothetical protein Pars92KO_06100 [Parasphingorhabdus sp.]
MRIIFNRLPELPPGSVQENLASSEVYNLYTVLLGHCHNTSGVVPKVKVHTSLTGLDIDEHSKTEG